MPRTIWSLLTLGAFSALALGSLPSSELDEMFEEVEVAVAAADGLCPAGTETVPLWQGEYPSPVVQVLEEVALPASAGPCQPAAEECVVAPGLYHPWAGGREGAATGFATVTATTRYRATEGGSYEVYSDAGAERWPLDPGDVIEVGAYYGEGQCELRFGSKTASGECPGVGELAFEELPGLDFEERQLVQIPCYRGGELWIEVDEALFARPEVTEGVITGYGEVGPAGAEGVF